MSPISPAACIGLLLVIPAAFDEALATARCQRALAAAAPRAKVGVFATQGGRIESGDWARLALIKTTSVQFAYLNPLDEQRAVLRLFPGDTLTQARVLYADASRIDALLKLKRRGEWDLRPNMHFGYREGGQAWLWPTADVEAYTNYWLAAMPRTGELKRDEWPDFMAELLSRGMASNGDQEIFDAAFTSTKRNVASPRPGLWCERRMDTTLDHCDRLAEEIRIHLRDILQALHEPIHTVD
jgi:hypothetical protein